MNDLPDMWRHIAEYVWFKLLHVCATKIVCRHCVSEASVIHIKVRIKFCFVCMRRLAARLRVIHLSSLFVYSVTRFASGREKRCFRSPTCPVDDRIISAIPLRWWPTMQQKKFAQISCLACSFSSPFDGMQGIFQPENSHYMLIRQSFSCMGKFRTLWIGFE